MPLLRCASLLTCALKSLGDLHEVLFLGLKIDERSAWQLRACEDAPDQRVRDLSEIFAMVLFALDTCGICPKSLCNNHPGLMDMGIGVSNVGDLSSMLTIENCLSELESFNWSLLYDSTPIGTAKTARILAVGLNRMKLLTKLDLCFQSSAVSIFPSIAESVFLPRLKDLWFSMLNCSTQDLSRFLLRHARTLRSCSLYGIDFRDSMFPTLLMSIRDHMKLETLNIGDIDAHDRSVDFLGTIDNGRCFKTHGHEKIRSDITKTLRSMRYIPLRLD
ncbi:hypothetical protein LTR37_004281 [Vermiconidia calcicola]|uniref:Uncharacterized protein n=1 Tax=Vermiconidia calcicola TaxID=1690605 RepID=A0ACC3NNS7_9PEZI|nr:hypothetical protein LTR37_004281 [Vermiconidia calcicola]